MKVKERIPLTPEFFDDGSQASLYSYDYCSDNYDKIYYAKGDEQLRKDMLEYSSPVKANHRLAGDIGGEFEIVDQELLRRLQEMMCTHLSNYTGQFTTEINVTNPSSGMPAWINYMKPGEYNPYHDHTGMFSFVWYLDIPEEIREEWKTSEGNVGSRGSIHFFSQLVPNQDMLFSPQTNDLFLFNANHYHQKVVESLDLVLSLCYPKN